MISFILSYHILTLNMEHSQNLIVFISGNIRLQAEHYGLYLVYRPVGECSCNEKNSL